MGEKTEQIVSGCIVYGLFWNDHRETSEASTHLFQIYAAVVTASLKWSAESISMRNVK